MKRYIVRELYPFILADLKDAALIARHRSVNVVMERFFLNLKRERVWQKDYANHAEATTDIADYIVNFCNAVRLHSTLGNLSPIAFEHQSATINPIEMSKIT